MIVPQFSIFQSLRGVQVARAKYRAQVKSQVQAVQAKSQGPAVQVKSQARVAQVKYQVQAAQVKFQVRVLNLAQVTVPALLNLVCCQFLAPCQVSIPNQALVPRALLFHHPVVVTNKARPKSPFWLNLLLLLPPYLTLFPTHAQSVHGIPPLLP